MFFGYLTAALFLAIFMCISEFFFIDEFYSRYNFIAVDYLVYTSEVLQNIWESYSIVPLVTAFLSVAGRTGLAAHPQSGAARPFPFDSR